MDVKLLSEKSTVSALSQSVPSHSQCPLKMHVGITPLSTLASGPFSALPQRLQLALPQTLRESWCSSAFSRWLEIPLFSNQWVHCCAAWYWLSLEYLDRCTNWQSVWVMTGGFLCGEVEVEGESWTGFVATLSQPLYPPFAVLVCLFLS